ncbi:TMEM165/GDT1 family protein [Taylorella equigenitalis]|uniref:TMEM165/GDT1 family protein n=1 Tax=Taylorella equigenitalis TaxID=29575 RepID=UPI0003F53729|nr:TMEM165/GDT1 family protein [Taylorella equigenitalis]ASY30055.1 hypothetical protein B9Z30_01380 [Taylorella equigenitalis]ASY37360.1 hypothetical protein CA605_01335 [Taylorella equigenitalis]ASY40351.1 hypothetical protein CAV20_01335 [Taylorella equigenitalis]ASY41784.1 hypothetical protein CA943_01330 [Taylorella equigenitalis]KGK33433.1 membrane protein [Taylorella equigenitalis]
MNTYLVSTFLMAVAEIGDKTQLLALLLAARYKKPIAIVTGILIATVLNHALAGAVGAWIQTQISPETLRYIIGGLFVAMGLWSLIPDKLDDGEIKSQGSKYGAFVVTLIAFFLAEMGDKTQIATIGLAAKYHPAWAVIMGTTTGLMFANVPAVYFGHKMSQKLRFKTIRYVAALLFILLGVATLLKLDEMIFRIR